MTQTKSDVCHHCGKTKPGKLPGGPCPHCLMALAMNQGSSSPTTAQDSGPSDGGHVPPIEKLVAEFPNLEIQHLIGHGGMGAVYQARQINLDRIVALKVLSPRLSCDPAFAERFLREARTLAKLSHPNIVTIFDFGQAGEFYYLTMEFVDGVNLRDTIAAKLLSPAEALTIVPQVCEALQYAHDNGIVHRDIKPENILIAKNGGIKIADFGLAKLLQPTPEQFTLTGTRQVLGTRNYMAPEQIESPEIVDHRADLYSLGVVFYELLTGELPLGRFSLPSEKKSSVSNRLDEVVMRTLEKDPNRRYQQASQIKTACESIEQPQPFDETGTEHSPDTDAIPLCRPIPITIEEIYAGLASGYGLLRGFETYLELEYEVRDSVVDHKWGAAKVKVPLDRVTSIDLHKGIIYTHINVQADRFEAVSEIPNSKQGAFRVYLKKKDRESAEQLVWRVSEILRNKPTSRATSSMAPMPPVKAKNFEAELTSPKNTNGLLGAILLFLFMGFCIVGGFVIILGSIWLSTRGPSANVSPAPTVEVTAAEEAPGPLVEAQSGSDSDKSSNADSNADSEIKKDPDEARSSDSGQAIE